VADQQERGLDSLNEELKQTLSERPDAPKVLERAVSATLDGDPKYQTVTQKIQPASGT